MGEQTTPEIIAALQAEGLTTQANRIIEIMKTKYGNFSQNPYPFGSEYSYDNTGEEAVYTLAKMNNNTSMMSQINSKTRACRGNSPLWYYYADPVGINGETWWQFQYTMALIGYAMNDWMLNYSATPELDARLTYAAKVGNLSHINAGQINADPENLGAAAWTYQAALGPYIGTVQMKDGGKLQNGWRNLDGEAQLGFWGAIRLLSADVANDPIFGLYGYGCDVVRSGSTTTITPKDGVFKRLNMISQKLSLTLEQDQYSQAIVGDGNDFIDLTMKNAKKLAHKTSLQIKGLIPGTYNVLVDNQAQGTFTARAGTVATVGIQTSAVESYNVKVQNTATVAVTRFPHSGTYSMNRSGNKITVNYSGTATDQDVSLQIFDIKGELVADFKDVANKQVTWLSQADGAKGNVYIARLVSGNRTILTDKFSAVW
jgi:hypothetical protein